MANDSANIVIAGNGSLWYAATGTSFPADLAAPWTGFTDAGFLSPDGMIIARTQDMEVVNVWQSFYAVRRFVTGKSLSIRATLAEGGKKANFVLAMGGGAIAASGGVGTYTPPDPSALDERAVGAEWVDGAYTFRARFPRMLLSDVGEITINRQGALQLDVTLELLATSGATEFTILSNHPSWLA